jgi:hypothetical protein
MIRAPRSPIVLRGDRRAGTVLVLAAAACLAAGCVTNGDFGRVRPELVRDDMHDWVGREAVVGTGGPASEFRTTDQERELRDRAYALIEPPYNRNRWDSVWREYGAGRPERGELAFDRTAYLARLHRTYRRSEASAYAQIVTDARNDVERLPAFFTTAGRVTDMDRRRAQSLAHVSDLTEREHANARARSNENRAIVVWVCHALRERVISYRYALERLVIAVPSEGAAETDRAISQIATQVAQYCGGRGGVLATRG